MVPMPCMCCANGSRAPRHLRACMRNAAQAVLSPTRQTQTKPSLAGWAHGAGGCGWREEEGCQKGLFRILACPEHGTGPEKTPCFIGRGGLATIPPPPPPRGWRPKLYLRRSPGVSNYRERTARISFLPTGWVEAEPNELSGRGSLLPSVCAHVLGNVSSQTGREACAPPIGRTTPEL